MGYSSKFPAYVFCEEVYMLSCILFWILSFNLAQKTKFSTLVKIILENHLHCL